MGSREPNFKEIWEANSFSGKLELRRREVFPDKIIEGKVSAQIFILKNFDSDYFQDKREYQTTITDDKITIVNDAPEVKYEKD